LRVDKMDIPTFTFHLVESPIPALGASPLRDRLAQWGLADTLRSARVAFDQPVRPHEARGLVRQLLAAPIAAEVLGGEGGTFCAAPKVGTDGRCLAVSPAAGCFVVVVFVCFVVVVFFFFFWLWLFGPVWIVCRVWSRVVFCMCMGSLRIFKFLNFFFFFHTLHFLSLLTYADAEVKITATELRSDVTRLSFFDTVTDLGLARSPRGGADDPDDPDAAAPRRTLVRCTDTDVRGVLVSDKLRHSLLLSTRGDNKDGAADDNGDGAAADDDDDPDNTYDDERLYEEMPTPPAARTGGGWPAEARKQLIFRIFRGLAVGGALCQYDEALEPYLDATKLIYKELAGAPRNEPVFGVFFFCFFFFFFFFSFAALIV
jgi:hypothetical protein